MNANIDLKLLKKQLKKAGKFFQRYIGFAFIVTILLAYSFLVLRISQLSNADPDQDAVTQQTNTVKRLKIDQNSLEKIEQLQDQNIGVQSLFEEARDNPFED